MSTTPTAPGTITTWKLDPVHSAVEFKVRHLMISNVKGHFTGLSGTLTLDPSDYTRSTVEVSIAVDSISTREPQRDGHLKSPDFFDAAQFPTITFKSTNIDAKGGSAYAVTGDFTMHGVTKSITIAVEDVSQPSKDLQGNLRIGLSGATKINRKDFGLTWNAALEAGGIALGEDIAISLEAQFIQA
jgi:polyisoprenoid-binding protein YceI